MTILTAFLAGMFFTNGIPHLIKGIFGKTFITLFKRRSSPYLNIGFAYLNFFLSFFLLGFNPVTKFLNIPSGANFWAFNGGVFFMAFSCAWLFKQKDPRMPWHKD